MFHQCAADIPAGFTLQANANDRVSAGARGQIARIEQEVASKRGGLRTEESGTQNRLGFNASATRLVLVPNDVKWQILRRMLSKLET